jgi:cell wall-associated NlpC family hydrolase
MLGGSKGAVASTTSQEMVIPTNPDMIVGEVDLLPGDVLLYRPRTANLIQCGIMRATGSPYTHAAIYLGDGNIAESVFPQGVTKCALRKSIDGSQCVAILRSQMGFAGDRPANLAKFVSSVIENIKQYYIL